jgi:hypothetical protein
VSRSAKLTALLQQQALRAATVQVEKILYNSPPLTLHEIQAKSWFRRKLLRQALEAHDRITAHGPRNKHRTYEIELLKGSPLVQLDSRLKESDKSLNNADSKRTPGSAATPSKKKGKK